jgi:hypothetical protein
MVRPYLILVLYVVYYYSVGEVLVRSAPTTFHIYIVLYIIVYWAMERQKSGYVSNSITCILRCR